MNSRPALLGAAAQVALTLSIGLGALLVRAAAPARAADAATLVYPLSVMIPFDEWRLDSDGPPGDSRFESGRLALDFSKGARAIRLHFPDRSLAGRIDRIRLLGAGAAGAHPIEIYLRTHFMTFHKRLGPSAAAPIVADGPPGAGWQWLGGENDGKIHGPMRLAEIQFDAGARRDKIVAEHFDVELAASAPPDHRVLLTARCLPSDAPRFEADLRAFAPTNVPGALTWTLRTWDGEILGRETRPATLPSGLQPFRIRMPPLGVASVPKNGSEETRERLSLASKIPPGCRFIEAEFRFDAAGQMTPPAQAYWLARPEPNRDFSLRPESPFGMGIYLSRFHGAEREKIARLAGVAGVKWTREDFHWAGIEPRRGQFNWTDSDQLLDTALRYGISVYPIVAGWPAWTAPYSDSGIADYCEFLRALARHYRGRLHQYEIWNEPNIFFWQGPRPMYAKLLAHAYSAVKEEDPSAQVLGLSTAGLDFKFIREMLALHAPFDVLTIHPYRRVLNDRAFISDLVKASDLVKLPDGTRRPVWLTEIGWATHAPHHALRQDFEPNTQRAQAELLARTYLCAILSGVQPRTFWYDFRNDGDDPFYFEDNMGIVQRDGRPKPAYAAFATLTRLLNDKRFVRSHPEWGGLFAGEFQSKSGARVYALWKTDGDARARLPAANARRAQLVNAIGESRALQADGGQFTVPLRRNAPVYLEISASPR